MSQQIYDSIITAGGDGEKRIHMSSCSFILKDHLENGLSSFCMNLAPEKDSGIFP